MVSEYQTRLPDKKLLQAKLHEFYQLAESEVAALKTTAAISPPPVAEIARREAARPQRNHRGGMGGCGESSATFLKDGKKGRVALGGFPPDATQSFSVLAFDHDPNEMIGVHAA